MAFEKEQSITKNIVRRNSRIGLQAFTQTDQVGITLNFLSDLGKAHPIRADSSSMKLRNRVLAG